MTETLRALLTEVIDYAGLFPPAQLPLDQAIRNYASYRKSEQAWMLARFICPAARLAELRPFDAELFHEPPPFRFSVLGRGGDDTGWKPVPQVREAFLSGLDAELAAMHQFREQHAGRVRVDGFETRLPASLLATPDAVAIQGLLDECGERFYKAGFSAAPRFFEVTLGGDARAVTHAAATAIAAHNQRLATRSQPFAPAGFKLRTGGTEAAAFPTVEQVAVVIEECRDAAIPLKFTAGLHHPIRRFDVGVYTHVHGFLNVFVAGVLAQAVGLDGHDLLAVLDEQDPRSFRFDDDFLGWNDAEASRDEVTFARKQRCISFGSCSFDEPRDDLKALGLLRN